MLGGKRCRDRSLRRFSLAKLDPLNTSRYWHVPDLPGMDMLHADFTRHHSGWPICRDTH